MANYYTNIARIGSKILGREIRNGKRHKFRNDYRPTLYVPTQKPSSLHTLDGTTVEPIQPGTINDCYAFIKQYKNVSNFRIYGNTAYEYAYINEAYSSQVDYKISDLVVAYLDIEVESKNGYSEAKDANNEIQAITIKASIDNVFHVFACQAFDKDEYNNAHPGTTVSYHECADELELLESFLIFWETLEPDILSGWNCLVFDCVYIINRIRKIMSEDDTKRLSPWGLIKETTINIYNKQEIVYNIVGVSILDYLRIYRKNVLEPRESYRLDYIAEVELGENKLDYGEHGSLAALYDNDFKRFIEYNIHDVLLVDRIDAKRKLIELQILVAYHAGVNFEDVISPVRTWDTLICNRLLAKNIVVPQGSHTEKSEQFIGAYVMNPIPGMYEWIVSVDVKSLYPNLMRTLNLSIETKLEPHELTPEMKSYNNYLDKNLRITDLEGKSIIDYKAVVAGMTDEFLQHFQKANVAIGVNGAFYRRDVQSFLSIMIGELFDNRVGYQKKLKAAKKELSICKDQDKIAELNTTISIYDLKQHSTKILLNSLYGSLGNIFFRFFDVENAEAVTTTGQFVIQFIGDGLNKYLNKLLKTNNNDKKFVIYSDSVTSERPVVVMINNQVEILSIEELFNRFKDYSEVRFDGKEVIDSRELGIKTLTVDPNTKESSFETLNEIIRHQNTKKIFRVIQKNGETRCTEDHSLISADSFSSVRPEDLHETRIAHVNKIPQLENISKIDLLDYLKSYSNIQYNETNIWFGSKIFNRVISFPSNEGNVLLQVLGEFIIENNLSIPSFIFHLQEKDQKLFLVYLYHYNSIDEIPTNCNFLFCTKSLLLVSGLTFLMKQLGYSFSLSYRKEKECYTIQSSTENTNSIEQEQYDGFVYDLAVDRTHIFVDACGQILLHNTDSCYITFKDFINQYYPNGTVMQKVTFLDKLCQEKIQPELTRLFALLTEKYLNGVGNYLAMDRECIGDKAIWTAKKRYIINVRDKEGIRKDPPELKIMGLEISKSSIPKFCRNAMKEAVKIVMGGTQQEIYKFVSDTKVKFLEQKIEDVSFPRSVNGLKKYGDPKTIFVSKGTPFHTKGTLVYNDLLEKYGLTNQYQKVKDGEKIKFLFLTQPNPTKVDVLAFLTKLPPEFKLESYIDWEMQFRKSFIEPLKLILNAIKWDVKPRASIAALFEDEDDEQTVQIVENNIVNVCESCGSDDLELNDLGICSNCSEQY